VIEVPKVRSFLDDNASGDFELLSVGDDGKCKVRFVDFEMDVTVTRHRKRIRPLNDAAKKMLGMLAVEPS
jgi:hypothetical protein